MAYRVSVSLKKRKPAWTIRQLSPCICCKTKPRPLRLASVISLVGFTVSKKDRTGTCVRDSLAKLNAVVWSGLRTNSFLVLNRGLSGSKHWAIVAVLSASWFIRPKNDLRSVTLVGIGKSRIAFS